MKQAYVRFGAVALAVFLSRCNCSDTIKSAAPDVPSIDVCVSPMPGAEEVCYQDIKRARADELCNADTGECALPAIMVELGAFAPTTNATVDVRVINRGAVSLELFNPEYVPGSSIQYRVDPVPTADELYQEIAPESEWTFQVVLRGNQCGPQTARLALHSNDAEVPPGAPLSFDPGQPDSPIFLDLTGTVSGPCLCPVASGILDFGGVPVQLTHEKRWSFESCGDEALVVNGTEFLNNPANTFAIAGTVYPNGGTLQPGEQGHIDVAYKPVALAPPPDAAEIGIQTNAAAASPYRLRVLGEGVPRPACILGALPGETTFISSGTRTFRIFNQGQIACRVYDAMRTAGSAEFSLASAVPVLADPSSARTLLPGDSFTFQVQWADGGTGSPIEATFEILADDIDGFQSGVEVKAKANPDIPSEGCVLYVEPDFGDFGDVSVGSIESINFSVQNISGASGIEMFLSACDVDNVSVIPATNDYRIGDLSVLSDFVGILPGAFGSTSLQVLFQPQSAGIKTATLRFASNSTLGQFLDVPLYGRALGAKLCYSVDGATPGTDVYDPTAAPPRMDWGAVTPPSDADEVLTLTNCGVGDLKIRGMSLDSASSPAFSKVTPSEPQVVLAPNENVFVRLNYAPTTTIGDFGALAIQTNANNAPTARFNLRGNYAGDCTKVVRCSPSSVNFGAQEINTSNVRSSVCTNFGSEPIELHNVTLINNPTDLSLASTPSGEVAPGNSFAVQVECDPGTVGDKIGQVQIESDACDSSPFILGVSCQAREEELPECIPPETFTPVVRWHWTGTPDYPGMADVWMTPVVVNLSDDNGDGVIDIDDTPDVVFFPFRSKLPDLDGTSVSGALEPSPSPAVVLSGDDGSQLWTFGIMPTFDGDPNAMAFDARTHPAVGDIDGDGLPEVLGIKYTYIPPPECQQTDLECQFKGRFIYGSILALEHDGTFKWESERWNMDENVRENGGAISLGDMDADGFPEIAFGNAVFDRNGTLLFEGVTSTASAAGDGEGHAGHGPISVFVDLSGDGVVELLAGRTAFRADGSKWFDRTDISDGYTVVGNFDADPLPEIAIHNVANEVMVLESDGSTKYGPFEIEVFEENEETGEMEESSYLTTAPALGDIDGDGFPEIIVAAQSDIWVFEHDLTVKWTKPINDQTGAAGPTTFDFEGDGKQEVVHGDEGSVWVWDGETGDVKYRADRYSRTITENAVIADVDNDGHAEIISVNEDITNGFEGVIAYGNFKGNWAATRRIWNQHAYYVDNISEAGIVPATLPPNWASRNAFRSNVARCAP